MNELAEAIWRHREYLANANILEQYNRERLFTEFDHLLKQQLLLNWHKKHSKREIESALQRVYSRQVSPRQAVDELL